MLGVSSISRRSRSSFAAAFLLALGAATSTLFTQVTEQCSFFEFNPPIASFDAQGGSGSVTCDKGSVTNGVYTGCAWIAVSNVPWIAITSDPSSNQAGFGVIQYSVQPNTTGAQRFGTITFSSGRYQDGLYTITQSASDAPPPAPYTLAPRALLFTYRRGTALPAAQSLNLASKGSAGQFTASATGGSWLRVTPTSGTTSSSGSPFALSVTVNPSGLTPGVYTGNIVIAPLQIDASPGMSVPVTLTVSDTPPQTLIVPRILHIQYDPRTALTLPPPLTVPVTSLSGAPTSFTVTPSVLTPSGLPPESPAPPPEFLVPSDTPAASSAQWISIDRTSGVTPAAVKVTVNPTGLAPGRFVALLRYTTGGATPLTSAPGGRDTSKAGLPRFADAGTCNGAGGALTTAFILDVGQTPMLASPEDIVFDETTPQGQAANVIALGRRFSTTPCVVSLNAPDGWLSLSPAGASNTPAFFNLSAAITGFPPQQFAGMVVFGDSTGTTGTVLTVEAVPGPASGAWRSSSYAYGFTAPLGRNPQPLFVNIGNASVTSGVVAVTSDGWLSASSDTIALPGTLVISAQTAGLGVGSYAGAVTISAFGANVPPLPIALSLTVTQ